MSSWPVSLSACWASSSLLEIGTTSRSGPPSICGIGGVLIGWLIYTAIRGNGSPGIDWVRWLIAIAVAVILVMIASGLTARSRSPRALSVRTPSYPRYGIRVGGSCVSTMISGPCRRL